MVFLMLEYILMFIGGVFVLTQVIIPVYNDSVMFPMFRRVGKLSSELEQIKFDEQESLLEQKVAQKRSNLNKGE